MQHSDQVITHHDLSLSFFITISSFLVWLIFLSLPAHATPSSLTISVTSGADPKIYIAPTTGGNFASSSATVFGVTTTHAAGYTLTAAATALTDGTNTIPTHTIAAGVSLDNYQNSDYAAANNLNNTWAYLPNKYNSNSNTLYLPAPITTTQTIDETNSNTTGGPYTFSMGLRIDNSTKQGSYASTLTLTTTAKPTPYSITYNKNTTDTVTNMPTNTTGAYSQSETIANAISSTVPARTGYFFKGWCTEQVADNATCTGTTYNPNGAGTNLNLTLDQTNTNNNYMLYAMWEQDSSYCPANNVCYDPNGAPADGTTDAPTMSNQSIGTSATAIELWVSNFKNPIKGTNNKMAGFAGWNTKADGTGTNYGPNETITITAGQYAANGLKLYANWIDSAGSLQGWTCPNNTTMPVGTVTALTDQRDNNTYAIAKLADGNCWMIENLRLDNTNSDNTTGALAQGYGQSTTYGNFSGLANPETANFSNSTSVVANSLYSTDGSNNTINIGTSDSPAYRMPRYNNYNASSPATQMTAWSNNDNTYSVGNWYTWAAAIADTSYYSTKNQTITGTSICPSGWHLPSGGNSANATNSDFWKLGTGIMGFAPSNNSYYQNSETNTDGKTGTQAFRSYPNNFLYSGSFYSSSPYYRGSNGGYWSSSVDSLNYGYALYLDSSNVRPGTSNIGKYYGFSVRCVSGS